jgi:hypothetical protein
MGGASPQVIARVLNTALVAQDLSGFAALLSDIARDRGLKGARGTHQSIYDMPYASLLPRQKHLLADAFDLFLRLGLEFRARGGETMTFPMTTTWRRCATWTTTTSSMTRIVTPEPTGGSRAQARSSKPISLTATDSIDSAAAPKRLRRVGRSASGHSGPAPPAGWPRQLSISACGSSCRATAPARSWSARA